MCGSSRSSSAPSSRSRTADFAPVISRKEKPTCRTAASSKIAKLQSWAREHLPREQDVTSLAIHHPLRHVNSVASHIGAIIDIAHRIDRAAVNTHPQLNLRN